MCLFSSLMLHKKIMQCFCKRIWKEVNFSLGCLHEITVMISSFMQQAYEQNKLFSTPDIQEASPNDCVILQINESLQCSVKSFLCMRC